jgi:hypothetical protein
LRSQLAQFIRTLLFTLFSVPSLSVIMGMFSRKSDREPREPRRNTEDDGRNLVSSATDKRNGLIN